MKDITENISKKTLAEINSYIKDLTLYLKHTSGLNRQGIYQNIKNAKEHRKRCLNVLINRHKN